MVLGEDHGGGRPSARCQSVPSLASPGHRPCRLAGLFQPGPHAVLREGSPPSPHLRGAPLPGDGAATQQPGTLLQMLPLVPAHVPATDIRVGSWGPPRALGSIPATILLRPQEAASGGPCPSDSPSVASSAMFLSLSFLLALPGAVAHPGHSLAALVYFLCALLWCVQSHI